MKRQSFTRIGRNRSKTACATTNFLRGYTQGNGRSWNRFSSNRSQTVVVCHLKMGRNTSSPNISNVLDMFICFIVVRVSFLVAPLDVVETHRKTRVRSTDYVYMLWIASLTHHPVFVYYCELVDTGLDLGTCYCPPR